MRRHEKEMNNILPILIQFNLVVGLICYIEAIPYDSSSICSSSITAGSAVECKTSSSSSNIHIIISSNTKRKCIMLSLLIPTTARATKSGPTLKRFV